MRRIAILDAPSNLGLRPPTETSVPGCAKAPGALRDHGLLTRLHARDAGCLTPPRYDPGDWRPGDGVCHATEIAAYSRKLADRIGAIIDAGEFPVILGGDCSIVLGSGLAMHRLGEDIGGRIGLIFVDGHSDFRHPGNASYVGAAAGEDLALATGRGQSDLAAIEGRRPYFRDIDVVVLGIRAQDEYRLDLQAAGIVTRPVPTLRAEGAARSAQWARDQLIDCAGYWVHVDMDVLDPAVMPAVDAPSPGGIAFPELELLLAGLVDTPHCLGVEITVFDPDYDTDGAYAEEITSALVSGLAPVRTVAARPDLAAARRDLAARADEPAGRSRFTLPDGLGRLNRSGRPPAAEPRAGGRRDHSAGLAEPDRDPVEERRAAADSVSLAAEEAAAPAVSPQGIEEAGGVEGFADVSGGRDSPGGKATGDSDPADNDGLHTPPDHWPDAESAEPAEPTDPLDLSDPSDAVGSSDAVDPVDSADPSGLADPADPADPEGPADLADSADGPDADEGENGERDDQPDHDEPTEPGDQAAGRTLVPRPLGSAPLLDSEPMPATRPGMLRPRTAEDTFSLPTQRPAFDIGPETRADVT